MKKYIAIIFSLFLLNGCAANIVTKTENSITLEKAFNGQETYVLTDEAKKHCAKKGKIPDLIMREGATYKYECVDK